MSKVDSCATKPVLALNILPSTAQNRKGNTVYVVEIKDDGEIADPSAENQKKFEYARDHFARLSNG